MFTDIRVKIVRELIALSMPHRKEIQPPKIILINRLVPRIVYYAAPILLY